MARAQLTPRPYISARLAYAQATPSTAEPRSNNVARVPAPAPIGAELFRAPCTSLLQKQKATTSLTSNASSYPATAPSPNINAGEWAVADLGYDEPLAAHPESVVALSNTGVRVERGGWELPVHPPLMYNRLL
jgi:hypothetical protein